MEEDQKLCELHKSLACEVDKGKFFRRVFGSKVFISILGFAFLTAISWCIWITNFTYVKAADVNSNQTIAQQTSKNIDEIRGEMKEFRSEISNQNEKINKNQQDILKILIDIRMDQRRANGGQKGDPR